MPIDRRELLGALGGLAASRALGLSGQGVLHTGSILTHRDTADRFADAVMPGARAEFPRKDDFAIDAGVTFLNAAYTHPVPKVAVQAARRGAEWRGTMRATMDVPAAPSPKELFAKLINAKPSEIAHVSSTSAGENLVMRALQLDHRFDGNVVTDGLHFEGALMHLDALRQRGLDVRVVQPTTDARIDLKELERRIDRKTRLVQISATASYNGFQHDLKAVADLAHAHGALVYADIVHAAGAEPLDVQTCDIDFAACSSFKWLMADFGLGFLYARERTWDRLTRPVVGYYQAADIDANYPPNLPSGAYVPVQYSFNRSASGFFEMGSLTGRPEAGVALLASSLSYLLALGVHNIAAHRQPLIDKLRLEMPRLGFQSATPANSTSGIITFTKRGLAESDVAKRLAAAKINLRLTPHWLRVSPSVYNDMADVERLLEALA